MAGNKFERFFARRNAVLGLICRIIENYGKVAGFSVDRYCYRCNNCRYYICNRKELVLKRIPKISESEWAVMKVLWKESPLTANEIVGILTKRSDWKKETVRTFINRLVQKKAIGFEKKGR